MRKFKLIFLVMFLVGVYFIFFSPETLAWWWQRSESGISKDTRRGVAKEEAEEKLIQIANQRLKQQIERLLAQNKTLTEENKTLQTELDQIARDRENLLKKLKDYTLHRRKLDTRIRTLEAGIVNLNQLKEELAQTNKTLSEEIEALKEQLTSVKNEREKLKEELATHKKKLRDSRRNLLPKIKKTREACQKRYKRQMNRLKEEIKRLKEERQTYINDNKQFRKRMKIVLNELLSNNVDLKRLKEELAIAHYNLGVMFHQAGDYKKALKEYQQVLKMKPDDAFSHYNLALIYEEVEKDKEKAIYHYNKYLQFKSDAKDALQVKEWITEAELEQKIWGEE